MATLWKASSSTLERWRISISLSVNILPESLSHSHLPWRQGGREREGGREKEREGGGRETGEREREKERETGERGEGETGERER